MLYLAFVYVLAGLVGLACAFVAGRAFDFVVDGFQARKTSATGKTDVYDKDGYDKDGFDKEGYDKNGYNAYGSYRYGPPVVGDLSRSTELMILPDGKFGYSSGVYIH